MTFWKPPVAIAHRGSRVLWPENTMEAFSAAIDTGVSHIETDIRVTADGVLVCFHDATVDRTTDGSGPVSEYTWDELRRLDAGYRHGRALAYRGTGVRVPALEDLVTSFPDIGFVLEMKAAGTPEPLARLIDAHDLDERVIVASFSDRLLSEFRSITRGRVRTSTGMATTRRLVFGLGRSQPPAGASALQVPLQSRGIRVVDARLIQIAHDAGLDVHVWTVNAEEEMTTLLDLGVDGVITDRPDRLQDLLARRQA